MTDAFTAGWEDGADDAPLTPTEIDRLALLLSPKVEVESKEVA